MGLLVADTKQFNCGLTLSDFAVSIRGSFRGCEKTVLRNENGDFYAVYRVFYTLYYFASHAAYSNGSTWIDSEAATLDLTEEQASSGIFAAIYQHLASRCNSTSNI